VYGDFYGFNLGEITTTYLCILVACIIGVATFLSYLYFYLEPDIMKNGLRAQEHRLVPALFAITIPVIGLFIFAWTSDARFPWIASVIGITMAAAAWFVM
jgi:DHA1 family multidrug resistance protein-like MFS transporter